MATNKVITVTTPSVVTNDTLASYNAYSDQDGSLGSLSVAEAAAGKTFALSDGVVHSVTVKPVGTSNGEFSAVISNAVTVDLSGVGTTYGLDFTKTEVDRAYGGTYSTADDILVEFTFSKVSSVSGDYIFAGNGSTNVGANGHYSLRSDGNGTFRFVFIDSETTKIIGSSTPYAVGDVFKMTRVSGTYNVYKNGSLVGSTATVGLGTLSGYIVFGAAKSDGTLPANAGIYNLTINTETWDFSEQTGSTATGSLGTVLTLATTSGNVENIWNTIV